MSTVRGVGVEVNDMFVVRQSSPSQYYRLIVQTSVFQQQSTGLIMYSTARDCKYEVTRQDEMGRRRPLDDINTAHSSCLTSSGSQENTPGMKKR